MVFIDTTDDDTYTEITEVYEMNPSNPSALVTDEQLLRIQDVAALTTLSKSCINLWVAQGRFPKPITLSKTVKLWSMGNIRKWLHEQQAIQGELHG